MMRAMSTLALHDWHSRQCARFTSLNGCEAVEDYGEVELEFAALTRAAGLIDLSFRGRLCLVGSDRARFLHGQVTNDINSLRPGSGCYAALVSAKGRMEGDLNVFCLSEELLLDFEPGRVAEVRDRLHRFLVADEVEVVDVSSLYGVLSVQGPQSRSVLAVQWPGIALPERELHQVTIPGAGGDICLVCHGRYGSTGFDILLPREDLAAMAEALRGRTVREGGRAAGWAACEMARVQAGIPRYGADMDATTFPQEAGIADRAVSYTKGCYIGQEILNRIHTMGHVNRELHRFRLAGGGEAIPGARILSEGKDAGVLTSVARVPGEGVVGLGYLRRGVAGKLSVNGMTLEKAG
jgi:folate-binding protein YgfZ